MKAQGKPKFIVAYSGGLDSTVLLHLCAVFFGPENILAVHVNHGLQAAAKAFESQAKRTCRAWGIRLAIKRLKTSPSKGESIEAWARNARYEVFTEVAKAHGIEHVFTAHHQDDQIETLLIALSRGAGLDGLRGIAENRPLSSQGSFIGGSFMGGSFMGAGSVPAALNSARSESAHSALLHRPLLECSREALLSYAEAHALSWIEDPSNTDPRFLRNRIRLDLMPALREALPGFATQASRSMAHLRQAAERLHSQEEGFTQFTHSLPAHGASGNSEKAMSRRLLLKMSRADQVAALRNWLRAHQLSVPSQAKLDEICKQMLDSKVLTVRLAHDGKLLRRERDLFWIEEAGRGTSREMSRLSGAIDFNPIDSNPIDSNPMASNAMALAQRTPQGWIVRLPEFNGNLLIKPMVSNGEAQLAALRVATPRSAQKMHLERNTPRKTLKNLFQAAGIPAELRKRLPCVTRGEEVLFVAGLGTAQNSPWKFEFLPDL